MQHITHPVPLFLCVMLSSFKACLTSLNSKAKILRRKRRRKLIGLPLVNPSFRSTEVSYQFKQVFNFMNANGDGKLTSIDLSEVLLSLGYDKSKATKEAQIMVMQLDFNGDGFIDLDEFMNALKFDDKGKEEEYLMDAFLIYDADKNGLISANELRKVMINFGCHECSLKDCKRMIKGVDQDGDGFVDFQEFQSMMTQFSR